MDASFIRTFPIGWGDTPPTGEALARRIPCAMVVFNRAFRFLAVGPACVWVALTRRCPDRAPRAFSPLTDSSERAAIPLNTVEIEHSMRRDERGVAPYGVQIMKARTFLPALGGGTCRKPLSATITPRFTPLIHKVRLYASEKCGVSAFFRGLVH